MIFARTMLMLLFCHALADYPLQGEFLSKAKNKNAPIPGIDWPIALAMHCLIHAGFVYLITGSLALSALMFLTHWIIDHAKCNNLIDFKLDQTLHILVLVGIALVSVYG